MNALGEIFSREKVGGDFECAVLTELRDLFSSFFFSLEATILAILSNTT
jgi:hypothetical protein